MGLHHLAQTYAPAATSFRSTSFRTPQIFSTDIVECAIALLSDREIASMPRDDLLDMVRLINSRRPSLDRLLLVNLDDVTLQRVLILLRRTLRARIDLQSRRQGWTPYFNEPE
jgi:hypothetical protein